MKNYSDAILIQKLLEASVDVFQEVALEHQSPEEHQYCMLEAIVTSLKQKPKFALFNKGLAYAISGGKTDELSLDMLKEYEIHTVDAFNKIFQENHGKISAHLTYQFIPTVQIDKEEDYDIFLQKILLSPEYDVMLSEFIEFLSQQKKHQLQKQIEIRQNILVHLNENNITPSSEGFLLKGITSYEKFASLFYHFYIEDPKLNHGQAEKRHISLLEQETRALEIARQFDLEKIYDSFIREKSKDDDSSEPSKGEQHEMELFKKQLATFEITNLTSFKSEYIKFIQSFNSESLQSLSPKVDLSHSVIARYNMNLWLQKANNRKKLGNVLKEDVRKTLAQKRMKISNKYISEFKHLGTEMDVKNTVDLNISVITFNEFSQAVKHLNEILAQSNNFQEIIPILLKDLKVIKNFYKHYGTSSHLWNFIAEVILLDPYHKEIYKLPTSKFNSLSGNYQISLAGLFNVLIESPENLEESVQCFQTSDQSSRSAIIVGPDNISATPAIKVLTEVFNDIADKAIESQMQPSSPSRSQRQASLTIASPLTKGQHFKSTWQKLSAQNIVTIEQSHNKVLAREEAYSKHNILALAPLSKMSIEHLSVNLQVNRFFQQNAIRGNLEKEIEVARLAREDWATDAFCPSVNMALLLNIAARMVVDFHIPADQLNQETQKVYLAILKQCPELLDEVDKAVSLSQLESESIERATRAAQFFMRSRFPDVTTSSVEYTRYYDACYHMAMNRELARITQKVLNKKLDASLISKATSHLGKTFESPTKSITYGFLGAPASGKSTISRMVLNKDEKPKYVTISTDDYRGVFLPGTEQFELIDTEQALLRTQDTAYLIKQLSEELLSTRKKKQIILDLVTLEPNHYRFLEESDETHLYFACIDDIDEALRRSLVRAKTSTNAADKGRFVNPSAMIHQHATNSKRFFSWIPDHATVHIYDTKVDRGAEAKLLALVTKENNALKINVKCGPGQLTTLANFFNKSLAHRNATSKHTLFDPGLNRINAKAYQFVRSTLLDVPQSEVIFEDEFEQPYLKITKGSGKLKTEVLNKSILESKLFASDNTEDKMLIRYIFLLAKHNGSIKAVNLDTFWHQAEPAYQIDHLIQDQLNSQEDQVPLFN